MGLSVHVPDEGIEGYSKNVSCTLNLISMFWVHNSINQLIEHISYSVDDIDTDWSWSYGNWIYNYLSTYMQSVPIITNVVSLNPAHGELYSIQHYVIKFVSDLQQVGGFLWGTPTSSTIKTDHHDITEILLKVM